MPRWLSKSASQAIRAAEQEARARRQIVGSPHLLLGLLHDPRGRAAEVLDAMGFSPREVRYETARAVGRIAPRPARGRPAYSPRTKAIFSRAYAEASRHGRFRAEPEDLLLALLAEPEGRAAALLRQIRERREVAVVS